MRSIAALIGLSVALAGCHRDSAEPSGKDRKAAAAIDNAVAANSTAAEIEGLPVPAPSPIFGDRKLPVAFGGRWGMTKADCDPNRMDDKGLLVVEPDTLKFYESRADVAAIDQHSAGAVTVKLNFTGEGQHWQTLTDLQLDAGDTQLVRIERSPAHTYRYTRC